MDTANQHRTNTAPGRRGPFARLRIRKKLMVLHTLFSAVLAFTVLLAIRPTLSRTIAEADLARARQALGGLGDRPGEVQLFRGAELESVVPERALETARQSPGVIVEATSSDGSVAVVALPSGEISAARARSQRVRDEVDNLYLFLGLTLVAMYGFVALTLELLILPRHVYGPIRTLRAADRALQEGDEQAGLISDHLIPADELGDVMRLRNESVLTLRRNEKALAAALKRVEQAATDLQRKNHLLETAKRSLADADRLASLGMMSAGIAHELNTPLAVIRGTLERASRRATRELTADEEALLIRVTGRLERLGESLLDFARTRRPEVRQVITRDLVQEAFTLVSIDRESAGVELVNEVDERFVCRCDPDRMLQVLVNLVRNAVDAVSEARSGGPKWVQVSAERTEREGEAHTSVVVADTGPGIDPAVLPTLFEPFVSTRLDAQGTGLGLAVAEGIVAEHGGVILAGNRPDRVGARFEILWPEHSGESTS
ncbi:MAG: ATP-binding protein [Planctomycetota bacterium]